MGQLNGSVPNNIVGRVFVAVVSSIAVASIIGLWNMNSHMARIDERLAALNNNVVSAVTRLDQASKDNQMRIRNLENAFNATLSPRRYDGNM